MLIIIYEYLVKMIYNIDNLFGTIVDFIIQSGPKIIYFGTGATISPNSLEHNPLSVYQQYPLFISNALEINPAIKVLIILLDKFNPDDYEITTQQLPSNVQVIKVNTYVTWGQYKNTDTTFYPIDDLFVEIFPYVFEESNNVVLTYAEFIGPERNCLELRGLMKKLFNNPKNFDEKILIDPTNGSDIGSYPDMTKNTFNPCIETSNNQIKFCHLDNINPDVVFSLYNNYLNGLIGPNVRALECSINLHYNLSKILGSSIIELIRLLLSGEFTNGRFSNCANNLKKAFEISRCAINVSNEWFEIIDGYCGNNEYFISTLFDIMQECFIQLFGKFDNDVVEEIIILVSCLRTQPNQYLLMKPMEEFVEKYLGMCK